MECRDAIARCLQWALRLAIGAMFVYAGMLKAMNPARFAADVDAYQIMPYTVVIATAIYLPWLEMICGAGLILCWLDRGAVTILTILMLIFIGALLSAWARGLDISCGCFSGQSRTTEEIWMLTRDVAILLGLILLALVSFSSRWSPRSPQNISGPQKTE